MTAELISRLTRLRSVQVIGRTASPYGRSPEQGISGAARALGVSALLEGSLYKSADSIRLVARLVDADSELHIWSGEFDASVADVLSVQQNVARQVVEALNVELLGEEQARFDRRATSNREAYQIYLRARYLIDQFDPVSVGRARDLFEQALDLDPAFPEAWAGLADAYRTLEYIGLLGPRDAGPRGKAAAQRALALDPGLAAAHTALATVVFDYDRDPESALEHYQQAIALEPDYATGRQFYAEFLRDMGRFDEALAENHRAQELDPLSPFYRLVEGIILHMARRAPEAIGVFERLLALDPRFQPTRFHLALACAQTGDLGRALEELDRFDPNLGIPDVIAVRGGLFAAMGRTDEVRRMQALLDQTRAPVSAFSRAIVHIGMGEVETALDLIEKAVEDRSWFVRLLRVEPGLDMLRAHPRFRTLLGNR
jgi:serine/threonine-protein kinase